MREKFSITIILILSVLLILTVGYIILDKYQTAKEQEKIAIYQQGMQDGYQQAVVVLFNQAASCQKIPVFVQNQTLNLVAVECLQQN